MLKIVGYADRLTLRAGESAKIMVSCEGGAQRYRADVVRLVCGDDSPKGPGYKEIEIANQANGDYPGRRQEIQTGSYAMIPATTAFDEHSSVTMTALIWPTLPAQTDRVILSRRNGQACCELIQDGDSGLVLFLTDLSGATLRLPVGRKLLVRQWYVVTASYDHASGLATVEQRPLFNFARDDTAGSASAQCSIRLADIRNAPLTFAARLVDDGDGRSVARDHFNGKIEAPRLAAGACDPAMMEELRLAPLSPKSLERLIGAWDFSRDIAGRCISDLSPNRLHGYTVNLPARGMKGHNWTGEAMTWPQKPEHYGAIHFHQDDLYDAGWGPDFTLTFPADTRSGVYAVRLRTPDGGEDHIPLFVRPAAGRKPAPVAFLASTATYMAYANSHHGWEDSLSEICFGSALVLNPWDMFLNERREFGLSTYDVHADGSGSCYSSRLRPILSTRPRRSLWNFNADLHIIDWLEASGTEYDVISDEDLHTEGLALLKPYRALIICTHPEYHSTEMLKALESYLHLGGRMMYLGGNGFYWRIAVHPDFPGAIEVRRAENGTRTWAAEPGEYAMSFNGETGGLWRNLGKSPQSIVGVGYASEGFDVSSYYRRTPASFDSRASFIFEGIAPNEKIGDFGFVGGGAAGLELDVADHALGTPPHALVVAVSEGHSNVYVLSPEELISNYPGTDGIENARVRADMVFFETPNGGGVFSVGSIAWAGSLAVNDYRNNVATITRNVLRRFVDDRPL